MKLLEHYLPDAEQDYTEIVLFIAEKNPSAARRFCDALDKTVDMLCEHPELGEVFRLDAVGIIRYRTVTDFQNYVIFYHHNETELLVIRVLHGGRDYPNDFVK